MNMAVRLDGQQKATRLVERALRSGVEEIHATTRADAQAIALGLEAHGLIAVDAHRNTVVYATEPGERGPSMDIRIHYPVCA